MIQSNFERIEKLISSRKIAIEKNTTLADMKKSDPNWMRSIYGTIGRLFTMVKPAELYSDFKAHGNKNFSDSIQSKLNSRDLQDFATKYKSLNHPEFAARDIEQLAADLFKSGESVKFINARHPFARLYSCWGDKMNFWKESGSDDPALKNFIAVHNGETRTYQAMWRKLIGKFENRQSLSTMDPLSTFSFEAFLRCVAGRACVNKHWLPIYETCNPCLVNYDYVTKLETVDSDSRGLLGKLKAEKIGSFPAANKNDDHEDGLDANEKRMEKLLKAYKTIDLSTIKKLVNIYKLDFAMFGYEYGMFLRNPYRVIGPPNSKVGNDSKISQKELQIKFRA